MISINFHYYSDVDCVLNFDVIIQGDFKNYKTSEQVVDGITNVFTTL